jgi:hypothetical protein
MSGVLPSFELCSLLSSQVGQSETERILLLLTSVFMLDARPEISLGATEEKESVDLDIAKVEHPVMSHECPEPTGQRKTGAPR